MARYFVNGGGGSVILLSPSLRGGTSFDSSLPRLHFPRGDVLAQRLEMDVKLHSERIMARGRCRNVEDRAVSRASTPTTSFLSLLPISLSHLKRRKKLISPEGGPIVTIPRFDLTFLYFTASSSSLMIQPTTQLTLRYFNIHRVLSRAKLLVGGSLLYYARYSSDK